MTERAGADGGAWPRTNDHIVHELAKRLALVHEMVAMATIA